MVVFWVVMSFAHVKRVWFSSAEVSEGPPAEELLWRFLSLEDPHHSLEVFHQDQWVGVLNFSSRSISGGEAGTERKELEIKGIATLPLPMMGGGGEVSERIGLRVSLQIREDGVLDSLQASLKFSDSGLHLEADFDKEDGVENGGLQKAGTTRPGARGVRYRIHQGDELLMDSANEEGGLVLSPSLMWLRPLIESGFSGARVSGQSASSIDRLGIRVRADLQDLAGRRRTVYVIEPELEFTPSPLEIHLTEGGEIVRIRIFDEIDMRSVLVTMSQGA